MATVKDIYNYINTFAPFDTQEEWDNSGHLVGDENKAVNKIMLALDITTDVINQAVSQNVDLLITHHPIIFKPVSNVLSNSLVYKLIENNISIICAHTNYDKAVGGVSDILCDTLGLKHCKVDNTCLNVGELQNEMSTNDFVVFVKEKLNGTVRYNNLDKKIKKVAVCSGSGIEYLELAKELNCDAFLTGDGSHHSFIDANEMGILLVCAGHFETENIAIKPLCNKIKKEFGIDCVLAVQNTPILTV